MNDTDPLSQIIGAVREHIEELALQESLRDEDTVMKTCYADMFPSDILHIDCLPDTVCHHIWLKDPDCLITQ